MDINCLQDILTNRSGNSPNKNLFHLEEGIWKAYTPPGLIKLADHVSSYLMAKDCIVGDRIGILSIAGSPLWLAVDLGILQIGCITVPVHEGLSSSEYEYIEKDAGLKLVFIDFKALSFEPTLNSELVHFYQGGDPNPEWATWPLNPQLPELKTKCKKMDSNRLATIIYTSGSTGNPKGVMLSHHNIISNINNTLSLLPLRAGHSVLSYLPVSHIFERMVVYAYLVSGVCIYFVDTPKEAFQNIMIIRPHFFTAVPRILETVYESLIEQVQGLNFLNKKIARWAMREAKKFGHDIPKSFLYPIKMILLRMLVFRKWRNALGGRLKGVLVGAAAMNPEISRTFSAAGIKIREGYGMTETSPVISFNRFEHKNNQFGTVGLPIPNTSVEIRKPTEEGEGEIWVKGHGVMMGYWQNDLLTKEVIQNGWFNTGDVGKFMAKRFLKITDRKKNIFKTSSGKYVYPSRIEQLLSNSFFVDQCMVIGFQKPYIAAIIVPEFGRLEKWCTQNQIHWTAPTYMVHNPKILQLFEDEIVKINVLLKSYEEIKKFNLVSDIWSGSTGELSGTQKLRRAYLMKKYEKEIKAFYEL